MEIEQGHVEARLRRAGDGLLAASGGNHLMALALETADERFAQLFVVIDDQQTHRGRSGIGHEVYLAGSFAAPERSAVGFAGGMRGTVNQKQLPWPGTLSTQMRPPPCSITVRTKYRPRPVPGGRPGSAGPRTNGSNSRSRTLAGIPGPLSATPNR